MARSRQKSAKFSPAEAGGAVAQLGERLVRNEEVRGSTPLGSTSLRSLRELRLGRPVSAKSVASEGCRAEVAQQRRRAEPHEIRLHSAERCFSRSLLHGHNRGSEAPNAKA